MPKVSRWFWPAAVVYLALVLWLMISTRQHTFMPVNESSAIVLSAADKQLQAKGFVPEIITEKFGVFWMQQALRYKSPNCSDKTWVFAADASVNLPQYVRTTLGNHFDLTYIFDNRQGAMPISLVRWVHRYRLQMGARLGLNKWPLSSFLLVAHPIGCPTLPDLRSVYSEWSSMP